MNPQGLAGVALMIAAAWAMSSNRARFPWRVVLGGLALQTLLALLLLRTPWVNEAFRLLASLVAGLIARADAGIEFVFGPTLADPAADTGFIFAVRALPVIIFFASLMGVLYYAGVMQRLILASAWTLRRTLNVTGAEALAMAANVFIGQTEAPLTVKPLIERMSRAQIMTLMVGGYATIAGSVLGFYVAVLGAGDQERTVTFAMHLITASVLSAPAAFVVARIMEPAEGAEADESPAALLDAPDQNFTNILDAAASGATDGLRLALNIGAMLIAFVSLLAVINWPLEALSAWEPVRAWREGAGVPVLTLEYLLGLLLAPLAWSVGAPWGESARLGALMGEKLVLTELVAYQHLARDIAAGQLSPRTAAIASYALCGFANFASVAIQIGGLSSIAPARRGLFAQLALRAMAGGALASWMTAALAGVLL